MDDVRWTRCDGLHIAYHVVETDPEPAATILLQTALFLPIEMMWGDHGSARFLDGLAAAGRLIVFDRRGIGISDPVPDWDEPVLSQWARDAAAVIEDAGFGAVHVIGWEWGAVQSLLLASQRPELVRSVTVLHGVAAPDRMARVWNTPLAQVGEIVASWILEGTEVPGQPEGTQTRDLYAPSRSADLAFQQWGTEAGRKGASPSTAARMWRSYCRDGQTIDHAAITAPVLSLRRRDVFIPRELSQEIADLVPDGRLVEVPGADLAPYAGDIDTLVAEIVGFATGETRAPVDTVHRLAAVLFTDIVGSTDSLREVGDDTWRGVLDAHDRIATRIVSRHGGRVVKSTGDGMLADFGLASQAVRAALGLRDELAAVGVSVRQGIHVGELVDRQGDVSGMAVHVAARVMAAADAGQVLATTAVQQAADRSTVMFTSRGLVDLKGIDGTWELFAVAARPR